MNVRNIFIGNGQLRSGWRAAFFLVAFLVCFRIFEAAALVLTWATRGWPTGIGGTAWLFLLGGLLLLTSATLVGWLCGALFERLSFRAVGWWPHTGWLKHVALGSVIGGASFLLAAGFAAAARGIKFGFNPSPASTIAKTAIVSLIIFVVAGAAEEALFRGYPLQTFTRAQLAWVGVLITAALFAAAHLNNRNASAGLPFINTAIAGVWLAIAYLRTRSLWFPLGLHWSWNWIQALLGIPVSGSDQIAPAPLLRAMNMGPDWLTGGPYGLEGGAACTAALLVSTIVIWRTRLVSSAEENSPVSKEVAYATASQ